MSLVLLVCVLITLKDFSSDLVLHKVGSIAKGQILKRNGQNDLMSSSDDIIIRVSF